MVSKIIYLFVEDDTIQKDVDAHASIDYNEYQLREHVNALGCTV